MNPTLRRLRALLTIGFILTLTGCVNLDEVADLGKLADQMRSTLPPVTADIAATCDRQNNLITNTPAAERGPLVPDDCQPYKDVADHVGKDQAVLIAYLDALSKLAANTPLSYDKNIDTNVATIASYKGLSDHAIAASTAAQKIAKTLADAATSGYREKKVNDLLVSANDPIQQLTGALKEVVVTNYGQILSNEDNALDTFYKGPMLAQHGERLALILVQRQYEGDKAALARRQAAAICYGRVMDDIASTHKTLADAAAKHISLTQIAKELGPKISDLKDSISDLAAQEK